jgi:YVTN family beta-propeller protein
VIDSNTNTVSATITVGADPWGISVSPDGSMVYVANSGSDKVSVITSSTNTVSATITVGYGPWGVSVSPDGSKVIVVNGSDSTVSVINAATNTVISTIDVGIDPDAFGNFISSYPSGVGITPQSIVSAEINVYPNPVTNTLTIDIPQVAVGSMQEIVSNIAIYNLLGEEVYSTTNNKLETTNNIDVSPFPSGVYVVEVRTEKGVEVRKFVKE